MPIFPSSTSPTRSGFDGYFTVRSEATQWGTKKEESVGMVDAFDRHCEMGECHATINLEWHICTCCGAKWFKHWRQSHFNRC